MMMWRTVSTGIAAFVGIALFLGATGARADVTAEVQHLPPGAGARGVTPYVIMIEGVEIKRELAEETVRYRVTEMENGTVVTVKQAKPVGFGDPVTAIQLSGDFEPSTAYSVEINLPNLRFDVAVTALEEEAKEKEEEEETDNLVFTFLEKNVRFEIEPMLGDSADGFGAKFEAGLALPDIFGADFGFDGDIKLDGEIGSDSDDSSFDGSVKGGATLSYFFRPYQITIPVGGSRDYHMGVRLKPASFEADQEFEIVDFTATLQVASFIPYTDLPAFLFGSKERFQPALLLTGYTYVKDVEEEAGKRRFVSTNRWDTEFAWAVPVADSLWAELRWKSFLDLDDGDHKSRLLAIARYALDKNRKRSITLSYKDGGDAPLFRDDSVVRIGFDIKLGDFK